MNEVSPIGESNHDLVKAVWVSKSLGSLMLLALASPLHAAAQRGNSELIKALLEHGASPAQASDDGKTALDFAKESGDEESIERLEEAAG